MAKFTNGAIEIKRPGREFDFLIGIMILLLIPTMLIKGRDALPILYAAIFAMGYWASACLPFLWHRWGINRRPSRYVEIERASVDVPDATPYAISGLGHYPEEAKIFLRFPSAVEADHYAIMYPEGMVKQ